MLSKTIPGTIPVTAQALPSWLTFLLALACGLIAANVYYAQPLIRPISVDLGLSLQAAGLIVTLTQLGYITGLIFVVPLADLIETKRLTISVMAVSILALIGAALATKAEGFLLACMLLGLGSVTVPILVPHAAHLVAESVRGRTVGNLMSGMMLGIMLARPVSSLIADHSSWHTVFIVSAAVMTLLAISLHFALPTRRPQGKFSYGHLLGSMLTLARQTPVLRRRAIYHFFQFAAFILFWTVTPLLLTGPVFHLSQTGVALFALAGVAGAIAAPIAGRASDRGWTKPATALGMLAVAIAFLITHIAEAGSPLALALLVVAAIMLDFGATATLVLGQRVIFGLGSEIRGRVSGVYMIIWYFGGALGSSVGAWAYAHGGWELASWFGLSLPVIGLLYFATEKE